VAIFLVMNDFKSYTDRITTPNPIILGLKLLPYTLGHSILLKSANSKFVNEGLKGCTDKEVIGELVFALLVCSTTYDEFKEEIATGKFNTNFQGYIKKLIKDVKNSKEFNLFTKIGAFASYLRSGTSTPLYYVTEDESEIINNPIEFEEAIISTLMSECNYTRFDCLNLPLVETLSAFLIYAHKQGSIELISKEVYEIKERMKNV
jgi:hypothetical protein